MSIIAAGPTLMGRRPSWPAPDVRLEGQSRRRIKNTSLANLAAVFDGKDGTPSRQRRVQRRNRKVRTVRARLSGSAPERWGRPRLGEASGAAWVGAATLQASFFGLSPARRCAPTVIPSHIVSNHKSRSESFAVAGCQATCRKCDNSKAPSESVAPALDRVWRPDGTRDAGCLSARARTGC